MPVIQVELPEHEIERLTTEARRQNMSLPELVAERVKAPSRESYDRDATDEEFREAADRVIRENLELLKRLA
jgi:hypothetical protein